MSDTKAVIDAFIEAISVWDIERALGYLSTDVQVHHVTRLPYSGEYRGHEGFRALLRKISEFWESIDKEQDGPHMMIHGPVAVVVGEMNGRSRSGQRLSIPVLERYRVEGGKIAELWPFYVDTHLGVDGRI